MSEQVKRFDFFAYLNDGFAELGYHESAEGSYVRYEDHERIVAAPIAQTAPQPAPGESWIPWRGGECPLPPSTPVEYRMRRDARSVVRIDLAGKLDWEHHGGRIGKSDVVAYRAALSAQQSAPDRVSVQVKLLRGISFWLERTNEKSDEDIAELIELRALLTSHGRGEA